MARDSGRAAAGVGRAIGAANAETGESDPYAGTGKLQGVHGDVVVWGAASSRRTKFLRRTHFGATLQRRDARLFGRDSAAVVRCRALKPLARPQGGGVLWQRIR